MDTQSSRLTLTFFTGVDEMGETLYVTKNFQSVRSDAADEQLMAFAKSYEALQEHPLALALRTNQFSIN